MAERGNGRQRSDTGEATTNGRPNKGHDGQRRAELAMAALLVEPTQDAAAVRAGVSERTLRNWLRDPAFRAEFRAVRRDFMERAIAELQGAMAGAVATLRTALGDGQHKVKA